VIAIAGTSFEQEIAFLNINPTPMLLPGFTWVIVQGRAPFTRMVTPGAVPRNKDLAIITVSPPPNANIPFLTVRKAILDLLVDCYGLQVRDVQRCPFGRGHAFVQFAHVSDWDDLVCIAHIRG
jgi:hypothetical protein